MMLLTGQPGSGRAARFADQARRGFTLIELILVMALLTIVISLTAPKLSRFFHGRTLDSEARRLLALTRSGQSRAVSEGVPMDLWVDAEQGTFGLEAEPSYETSDPKAVDFTLDGGLQLEVVNKTVVAPANTMTDEPGPAGQHRQRAARQPRPCQPADDTLSAGRVDRRGQPAVAPPDQRDSGSLWLAQSRDGLSYEIRSTDK